MLTNTILTVVLIAAVFVVFGWFGEANRRWNRGEITSASKRVPWGITAGALAVLAVGLWWIW